MPELLFLGGKKNIQDMHYLHMKLQPHHEPGTKNISHSSDDYSISCSYLWVENEHVSFNKKLGVRGNHWIALDVFIYMCAHILLEDNFIVDPSFKVTVTFQKKDRLINLYLLLTQL